MKGKDRVTKFQEKSQSCREVLLRALVSLSSLGNRRCVSFLLTAALDFSGSRVFPWSFAIEATQSLPEVHESDFDLSKRGGRGNGIRQEEWSLASLREEEQLSLHPLSKVMSSTVWGFGGWIRRPRWLQRESEGPGVRPLKVWVPKLCPTCGSIQVWGTEHHVSSENPTEPDLGEQWWRPWWLTVTPAGLWSSLFSPLFLPPVCCNHSSKMKPGSAFGDLTGATGLFPFKRHGFPLLSIHSLCSEKGKDPTPVKWLRHCQIWPGDTSFIKLWNVTYFFYSEARTSLGLFWFSWCFKIAVQCALLPRLAAMAFGQRSRDPDSRRDWLLWGREGVGSLVLWEEWRLSVVLCHSS